MTVLKILLVLTRMNCDAFIASAAVWAAGRATTMPTWMTKTPW